MRNLMENSGNGLKKSNIKKFVSEDTKLLEKAFLFHSKMTVCENLLLWQQPYRGLIL